jgi:RNA polymerase sigma-70 factor, ECF subfamily
MEADQLVQILLRERLRVTAVAAAIVRDVHAADDIFQQVVLSALEGRGQFREPDHVLAWAIRAARHRAIDLGRHRRMLSLPDEVLDLQEQEWTDLGPAGSLDEVEVLHRCIEKLAARARELLRMKYTEGLTGKVIAGELRQSPSAVYQSLSRIHRFLRNCVANELDRPDSLAGRESDESLAGRPLGRIVRPLLGQRPNRRRS